MIVDLSSPLASAVSVYLNGERLEGCIWANEEEGRVVCYQYDEAGHLVMDTVDDRATETRYGEVEVRLNEGAPLALREQYEAIRRDEQEQKGRP